MSIVQNAEPSPPRLPGPRPVPVSPTPSAGPACDRRRSGCMYHLNLKPVLPLVGGKHADSKMASFDVGH